MYPEISEIKKHIDAAQRIVIVQADNPDGDSLGSSLALEQILGDLGKEPSIYCAVDMPTYLRYMLGWDRVEKDLPHAFDLSIIVDASTMTLFERLKDTPQEKWLAAKPCIVLDHHTVVEQPISFATLTINDSKRASAGELIYLLSQELKWPLSLTAQEFLMSSILGDTQGLSNDLASATTYRIMGDMVDAGISRPRLEELRRQYGKMPPEIYTYKATLIEHTQFSSDGRIASVLVPQAEINRYSPLYNPGPLIQGDMLQTRDVSVAIVFKSYDDGRITAAIRCNPGAGIAAELASHFNGGGHPYASGFKVTDGRSFGELKAECLKKAAELLAAADEGDEPHAAV
jgi:phosphoesterase RecJ-like protein